MLSHFVLSLHEMTKVWSPNIYALDFFPRRKSLDGKYGIELLNFYGQEFRNLRNKALMLQI